MLLLCWFANAGLAFHVQRGLCCSEALWVSIVPAVCSITSVQDVPQLLPAAAVVRMGMDQHAFCSIASMSVGVRHHTCSVTSLFSHLAIWSCMMVVRVLVRLGVQIRLAPVRHARLPGLVYCLCLAVVCSRLSSSCTRTFLECAVSTTKHHVHRKAALFTCFHDGCCHVTGAHSQKAAVSGQATQLVATTANCSLYDTLSVCGPQGCGAELCAEQSKLMGNPQLVHV
jgi:hypothetical protein